MRGLILGIALTLALPTPLSAQAVPPRAGVPHLPPLALEAAPEALNLLRLVKTSSLDPYWRAAALARGARAFARAGDEDTTRTMARDAALALREPFQGQTPPSLSAGPINALIAAAMLSIDDRVTTRAQAEIAEEQLNALRDPVTRATVMPYLAISLIELNERERAQALLRAGLEAAGPLPPGRDKSTAFLLIVQGQARLGDRAGASASLGVFRSAMAEVNEPMERAFSLAMQGRAEAAVGNAPTGRLRAREAAAAYDSAVGASHMAALQRISTLAAIMLAQAETGDRSAARSTARVMQQTVAQISHPFERCQALILLIDSVMQIEPAP